MTSRDYLLGRLVGAAYDQGFAADPRTVDLSPLGFALEDVLLTSGDREGRVCYGLVARNVVDGLLYAAIRGTDDGAEWEEDAEILPAPSPWGPGRTHWGFTTLVANMVTLSGKPVEALGLAGVAGHSLGAALAQGLGARLGVSYLGLWASPRFGDAAWVAWLLSRVPSVFSVRNRGDIVPDVPLWFGYANPPAERIDSGGDWHPRARHQLEAYLSVEPVSALAPSP